MVVWVVTGSILLLLVAGFGWGYTRFRRRALDAQQQSLSVSEADVPTLAEECVQVFKSRWDVDLPYDRPDASARALDAALARPRAMDTVSAFERPGHPGWYARTMGAFLGELIRRNGDARWVPAEGGGLALVIGMEPDTMTMHPFDKIIKHYAMGDPGDLEFYVKVAIGGPEVLAAAQSVAPSQPAQG